MYITVADVSRVAQSVSLLATCWTVRGSNPGGDEIFRTCPDRRWGPPSLLYNGFRVFPEGKERPGRDADPLLRAVVKERVELYLYSPYGPYGPYRTSVPLQGVHFTFTFFTVADTRNLIIFPLSRYVSCNHVCSKLWQERNANIASIWDLQPSCAAACLAIMADILNNEIAYRCVACYQPTRNNGSWPPWLACFISSMTVELLST